MKLHEVLFLCDYIWVIHNRGTTNIVDAQAKDFRDVVEDALHVRLKQSIPFGVERA